MIERKEERCLQHGSSLAPRVALTNDQVEQMIATTLTAAIYLARLVVPYLRRQGGGRIMQLSSMGGHMCSQPSRSTMPPSGGIEGFFEALA